MTAALEFQGQVIKLTEPEVVIGREGDFFQINDASVSRKHCKICQEQGLYYLQDLGSKNGTYVNDQRLVNEKCLLPDCAYIKCGDVLLTFLNLETVTVETLPDLIETASSQQISNQEIRSHLGPVSALVYHLATTLQEKNWRDPVVQMEILKLIAYSLDVTDIVLLDANPKNDTHRPIMFFRTGQSEIVASDAPHLKISREMLNLCLQSRQALVFRNATQVTLCVPIETHPNENVLYLQRPGGTIFTVSEIMAIAAAAKLISLHCKVQNLREQVGHKQKLEMVGVVSAGIVHSFNNIIGSINGHVQLLQDDVKKGAITAETQECLDNIQETLHDAISLTRDILSYAKGTEAQPKLTDLGKLVQNFYKLYRPTLPANILFFLDNQPFPLWVIGSHAQLAQILLNLFQNAVQAMPSGGTLKVSLAIYENSAAHNPQNLELPPGKYAEIVVQDTGIGMDAHTLSRLFTPLFTTKPYPIGTGLGLAYTLSVVQQHHGEIKVQSQLHHGTTFRIYLPLEIERTHNTTSLSTETEKRR